MKRKRLYNDIFRTILVIVTSTVYSLAVIWFLEPANLISTGITAIGQILNRAFGLGGITIPIGVFSLIFNIPLWIYGMKTVSKRFVIYSV